MLGKLKKEGTDFSQVELSDAYLDLKVPKYFIKTLQVVLELLQSFVTEEVKRSTNLTTAFTTQLSLSTSPRLQYL